MLSLDTCGKNTDVEIWRRTPGDYYSPSIHVTKGDGIGINCHGHVIVAPIERWHAVFMCGEKLMLININLPSWRWCLAMWLLKWG